MKNKVKPVTSTSRLMDATTNQIRTHARKVLSLSGRDKTCSLCKTREFDKVVEVCHIIPIRAFIKITLIKLVNSINNLIYLCPSHHKMYDAGLIDLNGNKH